MKRTWITLLIFFIFIPGAMAADKIIEFTWQHTDPVAQGVTAFKVYMSSEPGANYNLLFELPFETVEETYTADGTITVPDNSETTRYFVATAVDAQGNESDLSNEATVVIDNLSPGEPITFKAVIKVITQ